MGPAVRPSDPDLVRDVRGAPGNRAEHHRRPLPGSTIAHWAAGADGRGVVLAGDAIFPTPDGYVTFLRSYPNRIPLSAAVIRRMADHVAAYDYDWLYNNFGASCGPDARTRVEDAAQRYIAWVSGDYDHLT